MIVLCIHAMIDVSLVCDSIYRFSFCVPDVLPLYYNNEETIWQLPLEGLSQPQSAQRS